MVSSNQKTIIDYFQRLYKDLLTSSCILTSIVPAKDEKQDIVTIIGSITPTPNRKKQNKIPIISLNYIDKSNLENLNEQLEEEYINSIKEISYKIIEASSIYYTLTIDYTLLNDEIIRLLKKKYEESKFTLKIIGDNYTLTKDIHEKISFIEKVYVDNLYDLYEDIDNCEIILNNPLFTEQEVPNNKFNPITEFYINKLLDENEYSEVIDYINNNDSTSKRLFIKVYNPEEYDNILDYITNASLDTSVELFFLGNPVIDTSMNFDYLLNTDYKINIIYSTNYLRMEQITTPPFYNDLDYYEELECNGILTIKEYSTLLKYCDEIMEKKEEYQLSPLEIMIYVYCYIEKNYNSIRKIKITKEVQNKIGYAAFYSIILRRLNIPTFIYTTSNKLKNIHRIQDKKYKLDRIILSDITSDVESNRYDMYNMFSFSNFGLSPISSVKAQIKEFITIPASLVISKFDYNDNHDKSINELTKFYNPTKTQREIACRLLENLGYEYDFSTDDPNEFYEVIANLLSFDTFEPLAETALTTALKEVINKEYPDYSDDRIELELRNAIISYRLSETEYDYEPQIEIFENDESKIINVDIIKSKRNNDIYNREEIRFANAADKLIAKIYEIKEEGVRTFTNNDHIINTLQKALDDLYKNKETCPLVTMDRRKQIFSNCINNHKENLFSRINEKLYYYLKTNIIDEISLLCRSKEMKFVSNAQVEDYNTTKYNSNYRRVIKKLKLILDSLASPIAKELGISYKYEDHTLTISVNSQLIEDYSLQIVSADIIAATKLKEISSMVISRKNNLPDTKINDFIELYIDTINKYNKKVDELNQIIYAQELLIITNVKNTSKISNYIDLEHQATKIEEEIFKFKSKLSDIRAEFFERYNSNINQYNSVQVLNLEKYSFTESYQEFLERYNKMLEETEEEILEYAKEDIEKKQEDIEILLNFVDAQLSCINRRVVEEGIKKNKDITNTLNRFYDKKKDICDKLEELRKIASGENIIIISKSLNLLELIQKTRTKKSLILNDKAPIVAQIIKKGTKLKLSTQRLNKVKKSKEKMSKISKKKKEKTEE